MIDTAGDSIRCGKGGKNCIYVHLGWTDRLFIETGPLQKDLLS